MPGSRALVWLVESSGPLNWGLAATVTLVVQAVASLAALWMLVEPVRPPLGRPGTARPLPDLGDDRPGHAVVDLEPQPDLHPGGVLPRGGGLGRLPADPPPGMAARGRGLRGTRAALLPEDPSGPAGAGLPRLRLLRTRRTPGAAGPPGADLLARPAGHGRRGRDVRRLLAARGPSAVHGQQAHGRAPSGVEHGRVRRSSAPWGGRGAGSGIRAAPGRPRPPGW